MKKQHYINVNLILILILIFILTGSLIYGNECSVGYGNPKKRNNNYEEIMLEPFTLFQKLDKDENGKITRSELTDQKELRSASGGELLAIWSLYYNFKDITKLHRENYLHDTSSLSYPDMAIYLTNAPYAHSIPTLLHRVLHLNYGLFPKGIESINVKQIYQGKFADCQLIAAIASFVSRPHGQQAIMNMIKDNTDGSFTVTFQHKSSALVVTPDYETIYYGTTAHQPIESGMWLYILEKAFLEQEKSSNSDYMNDIRKWILDIFFVTETSISLITHTTRNIKQYLYFYPGVKSIELLTGHRSKQVIIADSSPKIIYSHLQQLHTEGVIGIAILKSKKERYCEERWENSDYTSYCIDKTLPPVYGELPDSHAFSILDFDPEKNTVLLRNPWGHTEPVSSSTLFQLPLDGNNDGVFTMSLEAFINVFDTMTIEMISH